MGLSRLCANVLLQVPARSCPFESSEIVTSNVAPWLRRPVQKFMTAESTALAQRQVRKALANALHDAAAQQACPALPSMLIMSVPVPADSPDLLKIEHAAGARRHQSTGRQLTPEKKFKKHINKL